MKIDPSQITPAMRRAIERPATLKHPGVHNMHPKAAVHLQQCEECHGAGHFWHAEAKESQPCPECNGKGTIWETVWNQKSMQDVTPAAPAPSSKLRKAKGVSLPPVVEMEMAGVDPFYNPNATIAGVAVKARRAKEPNRTEREFEAMLKIQFPNAIIRWEQYTLRLANRSSYCPDFSIIRDGRLDFYEVKGKFVFSKSLVKPRIAAEFFRGVHKFTLAQKKKTGWKITEL